MGELQQKKKNSAINQVFSPKQGKEERSILYE